MPVDAHRARWLRAGYLAAVVAAVATLVALGGTPLYDGLGFPDQPYRYVQPPHGYQQQYKPTEARTVLRMAKNGNTAEGLISSGESGPQVAVYIPIGGLKALDSALTVTITARPVSTKSPPTDGTLNSNVYAVDFGSHPVAVDTEGSAPPNIALREATFDTILAVMEYRAGTSGPWRRLETGQVGRDIYLANLQPAPGQYVLIQPAAGTSRSARNDGTGQQLALVIGFCLVVIVGVLVAVRRTSRTEQPDEPA